MPRQSLRRYLTPIQLQEYQPSVTTVNNNVLIEAEKDIDNIIANFATGDYRKAFIGNQVFNNAVFDGQTVTVNDLRATEGTYSRVVVELLSGSNIGARFLVQSQLGNELTFFETSGITGTFAIKVYQLAKAPFYKDYNAFNNKYSKSIDELVKEAVAYQYVYRVDNSASMNIKYPVASESLQGENYSFNYNTNEPLSIRQRISPQAWDILGFLTVQSNS